jgi:hypothetical protein
MHVHRCSSCGSVWASALVKNWGRNKESDGLGPRPVCPALVPDDSAPLAKRFDGRYERAQQVCGAPLGAADLVADDVIGVRQVRPILEPAFVDVIDPALIIDPEVIR